METMLPPAAATSASATGPVLPSTAKQLPIATRGYLTLFASGDLGSKAILQLMIDKGVRFQMRDIRRAEPGLGRHNLAVLQRANLCTVPQLIGADGELIGDYDKAFAYLSALPDPKPTLRTA